MCEPRSWTPGQPAPPQRFFNDVELNNSTFTGGTITNSDIVGGIITGSAIEGGTMTGSAIEGGTMTNSAIDGGTMTNSAIEGGTMTGSAIEGGTITGSTMTGSTITDSTIDGSTMTGSAIEGGTITDSDMTGGTITDSDMTGSTITGSTMTGSTITDSTMTGSTITDSTMTGGTINNSVLNNISVPQGVDDVFFMTVRFPTVFDLYDIKLPVIDAGVNNGEQQYLTLYIYFYHYVNEDVRVRIEFTTYDTRSPVTTDYIPPNYDLKLSRFKPPNIGNINIMKLIRDDAGGLPPNWMKNLINRQLPGSSIFTFADNIRLSRIMSTIGKDGKNVIQPTYIPVGTVKGSVSYVTGYTIYAKLHEALTINMVFEPYSNIDSITNTSLYNINFEGLNPIFGAQIEKGYSELSNHLPSDVNIGPIGANSQENTKYGLYFATDSIVTGKLPNTISVTEEELTYQVPKVPYPLKFGLCVVDPGCTIS